MNPRGLPRIAASEYVGCSPRKFDTMVADGDMPQPRLIGTKKVWDRLELDEFFEALPRAGDEEINEWDEYLSEKRRDGPNAPKTIAPQDRSLNSSR